MVPAAQAQARIVEATIELLRSTPFKDVTSKKIADATGLAVPTIHRNFGSMNGLFTHVAMVLLLRASDRGAELALLDPEVALRARMFDSDFMLRAKLVAWLIGEGVEPSLFHTPSMRSDVMPLFQEHIHIKDERIASAWLSLMLLIAEGYAIFAEAHKFTEQETTDGLALLAELRSRMPQVEKDIHWD